MSDLYAAAARPSRWRRPRERAVPWSRLRRRALGVGAVCLGLTLVSAVQGCRTSNAAAGGPLVLRAGQPWKDKPLDLTPAEERQVDAHAHFAAGLIEELEERPETAISHYQKAAENDPDNEDLTLEVARKLIVNRRFEDARKLLDRASRRPTASGMIWGLLGTVCALQGNPEAAIVANQEAIRRTPQNIGAYQNLAQIYLEARQATNALAVLEQAANQEGADSAFLLVLANTLGVLDQVDDPSIGDLRPRIIALLDRAAAQNPQRPAELLRLADLYQLFGEERKSLPIYERLLETAPDLPGLRERLADIFLRTDNPQKAAEQLRILSLSQPTNPLPHYYLGLLALEGRRFSEAVSALNKVLVLRPDFQQVYFEIAIAHLSLEKPQDALDVLERARARFRPTFRLEFYSAVACLELERFDQAVRHFTAAEVIAGATEPQQLTALFYFQSGVAYERAKRFDDAAVQFLKAIELKPDFADALNYLGYMWAEQSANLERAHELIHKAVELEPDNAAFLDSLAWVLHQMNRSEEALPHQLRAVELSKEPDATLFDHLGDIYDRLGRKDEAREAWRKAFEVDPKPEIGRKLNGPAPDAAPKPEPPAPAPPQPESIP